MKIEMRISFFVSAFLLLLVLNGCRTLLGFRYGMTQPREETPEKLISFLTKEKFPVNDMYLFADSACYFKALRNQVFRKNMLSHMVFDRRGHLLERDTNKCQWAGYDFIRALNRDSSYRECAGYLLDPLLDCIQPFGDPVQNDSVTEHPDYIVVITWAKFIGKYNQRLFVLSEAVRENRTASIRLIYLNIDMQESWNLSEQQKVAIQ